MQILTLPVVSFSDFDSFLMTSPPASSYCGSSLGGSTVCGESYTGSRRSSVASMTESFTSGYTGSSWDEEEVNSDLESLDFSVCESEVKFLDNKVVTSIQVNLQSEENHVMTPPCRPGPVPQTRQSPDNKGMFDAC